MNKVYNFKRVEKKYIINEDQYHQLMIKTKEHLLDDDFSEFTVKNIYYDTDDNLLIRRSISKPYYKEKLRLRGYNDLTNDDLYLEIKKKCNKTVYKRRVAITLNETDGSPILGDTDNQIKKELDYFMKRYNPKPKYYIEYKRIAFKGLENYDLRITFDSDIVYRLYDLDIRIGNCGSKLLNEHEMIMEVKTNGSMPIWLVEAMNELMIYPTSYSKVGTIYKKEYLESRGI